MNPDYITIIMPAHQLQSYNKSVPKYISVKHTHTQCTHTHTRTLMHSHIIDGDGRTGRKDMKCLWQELQENRRVLREDFRTGIQKITREPCASFLLVMIFSYTLHDGSFFLWGVTWGVPLRLTHPVLVYAWSTSCGPLCWVTWGVSLTCPVLVYMWSFSYTPHAGFFLLLEFLS